MKFRDDDTLWVRDGFCHRIANFRCHQSFAKAIKDSIKAEMQERNVEELTAGKYIIRWTSVISNRFDSSAFKKPHGELYKAFCKATEFYLGMKKAACIKRFKAVVESHA